MGLHLPASCAAWDSEAFETTLSYELAALGANALPLQGALRHTSHSTDAPIVVRVIASHATDGEIQVRIGVFFAGIVAGCSCADDPTPVEEQPEYAEFRLTIDRASASARATPLED